MNILAGLRAIERTPCTKFKPKETRATIKKYKRLVRDMSQKEIKANNETQVSTVVKMCLDGFSVDKITQATRVSANQIYVIKNKFGLIRKSTEDHKRAIKNLIMESTEYTHSIASIYKALELDKNTICRIIRNTPQIERGTGKNLKHKFRYNFDIKFGDGDIARGTVY